jgi:hypothetical protein
VALLSHPLCHSGVDRGDHLRFSREFELDALRGKVAFPEPGTVRAWAAATRAEDREKATVWADWLSEVLWARATRVRSPSRIASPHRSPWPRRWPPGPGRRGPANSTKRTPGSPRAA